jgi:hypothetical protein
LDGGDAGADAGLDAPLDVAVDSGPDVGVDSGVKRVFVTRTAVNGAFGGVAAADVICQADADDAGIGGVWIAWVGTDSPAPVEPGARVSGTHPYRTMNDASIGTALYTDGPLVPIRFGPDKSSVDAVVWTGALAGGQRSGSDCGGWKNTTGSATVGTSFAFGIGGKWANDIGQVPGCDNTYHFYCFEK